MDYFHLFCMKLPQIKISKQTCLSSSLMRKVPNIYRHVYFKTNPSVPQKNVSNNCLSPLSLQIKHLFWIHHPWTSFAFEKKINKNSIPAIFTCRECWSFWRTLWPHIRKVSPWCVRGRGFSDCKMSGRPCHTRAGHR